MQEIITTSLTNEKKKRANANARHKSPLCFQSISQSYPIVLFKPLVWPFHNTLCKLKRTNNFTSFNLMPKVFVNNVSNKWNSNKENVYTSTRPIQLPLSCGFNFRKSYPFVLFHPLIWQFRNTLCNLKRTKKSIWLPLIQCKIRFVNDVSSLKDENQTKTSEFNACAIHNSCLCLFCSCLIYFFSSFFFLSYFNLTFYLFRLFIWRACLHWLTL